MRRQATPKGQSRAVNRAAESLRPLPARLANHRCEVNLRGRTRENVVTDDEARRLEDAQPTGEIEILDDLVGNAGCSHVVAQAIDVKTHASGRGKDCLLLPGA